MSIKKRRGGYLATAKGVKKLKEAKRVKKYTYQNIAEEARETLDKVKRLFNPQWGNGGYKVGEEAVEAICSVLDLKPEEIVNNWYISEIFHNYSEVEKFADREISNINISEEKVIQIIKQAAKDKVEELDLSGMEITELSPEIGRLTSLIRLDLGRNYLCRLPPEIGNLSNLKFLDVRENKLNQLPTAIKFLKNLQELILMKNELSNSFKNFKYPSNLKKLNLIGNKINNIHSPIFELRKLQSLYLGSNNIFAIPNEIGRLNKLVDLKIQYNDIHFVSYNLFKIKTLEKLYLDSNSIKEIPAQIKGLTSLKELSIDNNLLKNIPSEIAEVTDLNLLNLSYNHLDSLPSKIEQLADLKTLNLCNNNFTDFPSEILVLNGLETLYLDQNRFSHIPSKIKNMVNLKELFLFKNRLNALPSEIGQLANLKILDVRENCIAKLPHEMKQLANLESLLIKSTSLPIPAEIIDKFNEPHTIINYYFSLENNLKRPLHEAKMLLVGQGSVGKTCLRERLIRNKYDPTRNKTDGIDIESWEIEVGERDIQVNVWDFGGQEIMHSTHQFFLTLRSLYLLVIDTTQGEEENRLEHWLKIIQSFAKDSPVIIVGNKADQHPLDIDKRGLQQKYPQIKAFIEVSCQDFTGIEELEIAVKHEIDRLKHVNDELPLPWFNIKTQLEELDKDYIPYSQYESLCEAEGIMDEDRQSILIRLLHDLGIVLNFRDDPRLEDTHVLNPEWVTNGVYKILNNHQLIVEDKGILDRTMLPKILDRRRYPKNKYLFIIDTLVTS